MKLSLSICLALFLFPVGNLCAETIRFGLIIGHNEGARGKATLRYAEQDAKKVYDVLVEQGNFAPKNLTLVAGGDKNRIWSELARIERQLRALKTTGNTSTLLLFYFSGHADGDVLELGDTTVDFEALKQYLKKSSAKVRLAFVDACHSGVLISNKGGRRVPGFDIRIADSLASDGYAILTSSADDELSQESEEIRGSFFTHYLVSALRGAADQSGDGGVTLSEAYQYAYAQTVARTSRTVAGGQHPMYDFNLSGKGDVILTRIQHKGSGVSLKVPLHGRLLIMDGGREHLVAEINARPTKRVVLGLRPGRYWAYILGDQTQQSRFEVRAKGLTRVDPPAFETIELEQGVPKGGLFKPRSRHSVGGAFLLRRWPLTGGDVSYGGALHYRIDHLLPLHLSPALRLMSTSAPDVASSTGYVEMSAQLGLGWWIDLHTVILRIEALVGYEHLFQRPDQDRLRHSAGYTYTGLLSTQIPLGSVFSFTLTGGIGGRGFELLRRDWVHRLDWQALAGVGIVFQNF